MASMNISLPEQMKKWVDAQVAAGRYASISDYMLDLLRKEQIKQESIENLRREIEKGRASGISAQSMDDIWESVVARAAALKAS